MFRIFTDASLYLFTLPITIPISLLIYYLINVYRKKNKNPTIDEPLKETVKPSIYQIPFDKPITLRILISTWVALLILIALSFFDFWNDLFSTHGLYGSKRYYSIMLSIMRFPVFAFIIYILLHKLKKIKNN